MKTKSIIMALIMGTMFACNGQLEEDVTPIQIDNVESCTGEGCDDSGEDPVVPPCYPDC